jgi:nitrogen regulatory protein PII
MKLVTAVVKPFKLDEVKVALTNLGVTGMTVTQARGFGRQGGHIEIYRGREYEFDFIDKIQIEVACTDEQVEDILDAIVTSARTGTVGDGKVWVTDVERVVRVRTNERGPEAL